MKLLAAISQHGLGHLAQAGPVLNALRTLHPALELTVWSGLGQDTLQARINGPFEHRAESVDFGLIMHDAMRVDCAASHAAYQDFHVDWSARVRREAAWLRVQAFDLVFSDVAYLPLAAAAAADIEHVALCSLNWADIARAYLTGLPGMAEILDQMHAAYASCRVFLQPEPSMPMVWLPRRQAISPIASLGRNRRAELIEQLALPPESKLVLLGFGGIGYAGRGDLPAVSGVVWLTPEDWNTGLRCDRVSYSRSGLPFLDLLASCDTLITKVGYGGFVEAAAHAVPVLYLDRPDWPETPFLARWLFRHATAAAIDENTLFCSRIAGALENLWLQPRKTAICANGAEQAARQLLAR